MLWWRMRPGRGFKLQGFKRRNIAIDPPVLPHLFSLVVTEFFWGLVERLDFNNCFDLWLSRCFSRTRGPTAGGFRSLPLRLEAGEAEDGQSALFHPCVYFVSRGFHLRKRRE